MATIDETNIFAPQDPDTGQTYQLFNADAIKQKQVQSKEQYNLIKDQIKAGNLDQAYEGFTQLPFSDQMLLYINPVTGVPLESYEVVKFGAEAQPRFKTFKEFGLDMLDPRKKLFGGMLPSPVKVGDEGSALMSGLAGLGVLGGAFDLANIPKAILSPFVRKAPLYSKQEGAGGGGGGIGGLTKQEFVQKEINEKARDGLFVSNLNKYLISTAPKNLKGQALFDHIQANKSKGGYKADEIKFSGLETFIKDNPQATTQEAIDYLSLNTPKVESKKLVDPVSDDSVFMEPKADPTDPLDGTDHSLFRSADILEDLKKGDEDIFDSLDDVDDPNLDWAGVFYNARANQRISEEGYERLMNKIGVSEPGILPVETNLPANDVRRQGMFEDLADEMSMKEFYDDPYKLIELDEGVGSTLKAYGNENVGFALVEDGQKIDLERPIYTEGEARNQMQLRLQNEGVFTGRDGSTKYKDYFLDDNMPFVDGYDLEEIPLSMPILAQRGLRPYAKTHYPEDEYPIGSYAKIETKLEDGRDARYILEFQSDLHQKGASEGYNRPQDIKYYDDVILPQLGDDVERQAKAILGDDEFNRIKNKYLDNQFVDEFYLDLNETIGRDFNRGDGLETYRVWKQSKNNRYLADQELPDEYPHKEFVPVVVKDTIAKAIEDGVDTIAFPTSIPILERTGKKPKDIKTLFISKIAKPTQQDRDIFKLDKNISALELGTTNKFDNYFGTLEDVVDHLVDLKQMDRQLKKYPNIDFSLPETRQKYIDFGIDTYRYTKDDPNFDANLIDQFSREIEQDLNMYGFEVVERVNTYDNPKLQRLYDQDDPYNDDFVKKEIEAIAETQPLTARAMKELKRDSSQGAVLYNKAEDKFVLAKDFIYDTGRKIMGQEEFVIYNPMENVAVMPHLTFAGIENRYNKNIANQIRKLDEEGKIPHSFDSQFGALYSTDQSILKPKFEDLDAFALDVNKKVGGEKFITDYDEKLPAELKRVANKYGGKFEKGSLDAEDVYGNQYADEVIEADSLPIKRLEVNILRITPEMKKKIIEEGMPQMYKGGIVIKSQSMDRPIAGNTRYV
jgi:hypothetical protein